MIALNRLASEVEMYACVHPLAKSQIRWEENVVHPIYRQMLSLIPLHKALVSPVGREVLGRVETKTNLCEHRLYVHFLAGYLSY